MAENVERLERESDQRRYRDIFDNRIWKFYLGFAILASILDVYVAIDSFYVRSHVDGRVLSVFSSCMAILIPWLGMAGVYRRGKAQILTAGFAELWPTFRYSCVLALSYTYLALSLVLGMCLKAR